MTQSPQPVISAFPADEFQPDDSPDRVRFALICTLFLLTALWLEPHFSPLCHLTADQVGVLLGLTGLSPHVQGDLVRLPGFAVRIVTECTPLYACLLYAAFVLARPASLRCTLTGLCLGFSVIIAANLLRVAFVTAIGPLVSRFAFDALHVYLGQVAMLLLVMAAALAWQRWSSAGETPFPFLVRALSYATVFFLPWVVINRSYLALLDSLVAPLFSLLYPGHLLLMPRPLALYNHTFAVPFFLALVVAGREPWTVNRFAATVAGVYMIAGWHVLFRVSHVVWTALDVPEIEPFHQGIYLLGQFLLPFLLWLWLKALSYREGVPGTCQN